MACKKACFPPRRRNKQGDREFVLIGCFIPTSLSQLLFINWKLINQQKTFRFNCSPEFVKNSKDHSVLTNSKLLFKRMATLRNKRKMTTVSRETREEYPWKSQSRNTSVRRIVEDHTAQIFEEIEDSVTKKLSEGFSMTESHNLCALSEFDKFVLKPQIRTLSGAVPGTSGNTEVENQEPKGDRSRKDPYLKVEYSVCRSRNSVNLDPEEADSHLQESRKRTALPVNRHSSVRKPLRRLKQTKICWPFSS